MKGFPETFSAKSGARTKKIIYYLYMCFSCRSGVFETNSLALAIGGHHKSLRGADFPKSFHVSKVYLFGEEVWPNLRGNLF